MNFQHSTSSDRHGLAFCLWCKDRITSDDFQGLGNRPEGLHSDRALRKGTPEPPQTVLRKLAMSTTAKDLDVVTQATSESAVTAAAATAVDTAGENLEQYQQL